MKFKQAVGKLAITGDAIEMQVKASGALKYGDVVIWGTQDLTQAYPVVATTTSADSALVAGVISEPGGIADGAVGRMTVLGIADVTVVSGTHNAGTALTTSTTAGAADDGTETLLNHFGKVMYTAGGTVTTVKAWVNVL